MVLFKAKVGSHEKEIYMDDTLYNQLQTTIIPGIQKKDKDAVYIVDGGEGDGKSVFAMQLAKCLDPNYNISKCAFTASEFTNKVVKAKKGDCIIYDEAFTGLSSRGALSEVNKLLVGLMMEMRQKNLFVIIVMPTFFLLDKYVAIWRAKGLFHIYTKKGKRGYWMFFNNKAKKILYLSGKKLYSYSYPKSTFIGRFYNHYTIDEYEYRKKKSDAMQLKTRSTRAETWQDQRNKFIFALHEQFALKIVDIAMLCKKYRITLTQSGIKDILKAQIRTNKLPDGINEDLSDRTEQEKAYIAATST